MKPNLSLILQSTIRSQEMFIMGVIFLNHQLWSTKLIFIKSRSSYDRILYADELYESFEKKIFFRLSPPKTDILVP